MEGDDDLAVFAKIMMFIMEVSTFLVQMHLYRFLLLFFI
ncbi:hypothetical protein FLACOL7796_04647 [Flavobacterium collinsii]|uniref:Uncharacterized protein n=1 Tax=Flavobacterium collinsii TaxID=1114861 RepID=A0ABM8KQ32_9FLAO|nr:hypothetical protein FLACOL7796_04647 [Flavobacterium collinsii]